MVELEQVKLKNRKKSYLFDITAFVYYSFFFVNTKYWTMSCLLSYVWKLPFFLKMKSPLPLICEEPKIKKKTTLQISILYEFLYIYKIIVICNAFLFLYSSFLSTLTNKIIKFTHTLTHTHTLYPVFLVSKCTCICMISSADTYMRVWRLFSSLHLLLFSLFICLRFCEQSITQVSHILTYFHCHVT